MLWFARAWFKDRTVLELFKRVLEVWQLWASSCVQLLPTSCEMHPPNNWTEITRQMRQLAAWDMCYIQILSYSIQHRAHQWLWVIKQGSERDPTSASGFPSRSTLCPSPAPPPIKGWSSPSWSTILYLFQLCHSSLVCGVSYSVKVLKKKEIWTKWNL